MSNDVIDLCGSPEPAGAARLPSSPRVIDILDDHASDAPRPQSGKTDPNERGRKRKRPWKSVRSAEDTFQVTGDAAAAGQEAVDAWVNDIDTGGVAMVGSVVPPRPELQVLEVFPDANVQYIMSLLKQYENSQQCSAQLVIAHMVEHGYEKSTKHVATHRALGDPVVHMQNGTTSWKYDFMSTESFEPTANYVIQATDQLLCDFPFLSKKEAQVCMRKFSNHYAVVHDKILSAVKGTKTGEKAQDEQFQRLLSAFSGMPLQKDEFASVQAITGRGSSPLKRPRKKNVKPLVTDVILTEELKYVKGKLKDWMDTIRARQDRQRKKDLSQKDGTAVDCSCCFDSYPMDDMVACRDEGHLFCQDCLKSVVENLIFGQGNLGIDKNTKTPALELKCFHGDGCSSGFHRGCLEKALPPKSLRKYDEVQFQVSIERAGLCDICSCPKCGFQADVPPEQKIFQCPVAECGYESCRECGEAAHIPLRCSEVEKEKETKGRLTVEEAISAVLIRKCPSCAKCFIKSDGCNKVTCGCGAFVCYLCCQRIQNYQHFCQTPHCEHKKCRKCPLYTKDEEDNARAMRDAGYAAAEEVRKQSLANGQDKTEEELRVDVEGILKAK